MKVKYLVLSDIHLGHNINKTELIVTNLSKFFLDYKKQLKDLNMIFLAGDIFDRLLVTSGKDFICATEWLTELILYCQKHSILLRILEGTPSHDWKQAKLISTIIEKFNIELDYKYIDTLAIEYIDKFNLHVLYIPDEYKNKAEDTYKDVLKLLKTHKLSQVDIGIFHGQFHYQLPIRLESSHDESSYLNIVKHYISIGHIHTCSIFDRILAQGSFDRLAHNEEEDKGGMLITLDDNLGNRFEFLPNRNAMIFKTISIDQDNLESILEYLDQELKKIKSGSNIRLVTNHEEFLTKNIDTIRCRYPTLTIKITKDTKSKDNKISLLDNNIVIDSFNITKDNIEELLSKEMEKHGLTQKELDIFKEELKEVI